MLERRSPSYPSFLPGPNSNSLPTPPQDAGLASLPDKQLKQTVMPFSKFKMEEAASAGAQVGRACVCDRGDWAKGSSRLSHPRCVKGEGSGQRGGAGGHGVCVCVCVWCRGQRQAKHVW